MGLLFRNGQRTRQQITLQKYMQKMNVFCIIYNLFIFAINLAFIKFHMQQTRVQKLFMKRK